MQADVEETVVERQEEKAMEMVSDHERVGSVWPSGEGSSRGRDGMAGCEVVYDEIRKRG